VLDVHSRSGGYTRSTETGFTGGYDFTNVTGCTRRSGDTCTVSVLGPGRTVEDRRAFHLRALTPSVAVVDLAFGRLPNRFFVAGQVLTEGAAAGRLAAAPATDLTISVLARGKTVELYRASAACRSHHWAEPNAGAGSGCSSHAGAYLLANVPLSGNDFPGPGKRPLHAVITLLERGPDGQYRPVDSAPITLPADTPASNADPPTTSAPDLVALDPAPSRDPGLTLTGQVLTNVGRPALGAPVVVHVHANATDVTRSTVTDSSGNYQFTAMPLCSPAKGDTCTVSVGSGRVVLAQQPFSLGPHEPSVTVVNLRTG
jgi:hypothetical protein